MENIRKYWKIMETKTMKYNKNWRKADTVMFSNISNSFPMFSNYYIGFSNFPIFRKDGGGEGSILLKYWKMKKQCNNWKTLENTMKYIKIKEKLILHWVSPIFSNISQCFSIITLFFQVSNILNGWGQGGGGPFF